MSFKIGDRVRHVPLYGDSVEPSSDKIGTIVNIRTTGVFGVEFDEHIHGHDCDGYARLGHGWNLVDLEIELVFESKKTIGRSKLEFVWP